MGVSIWRYLVRNLAFNSKAIVLICINDAVPLPCRPPLPHAVLILGRFTGYTNSGPIYRLYRAAVNELFAHLREFASFTDCVTTPITLQCWPTTYFGNLFLQTDQKDMRSNIFGVWYKKIREFFFVYLQWDFLKKIVILKWFITKCFGTKMRYTLFANVFRRVLCNREIIRDIQSLQIRHYCLEPWPWIINAIVLTYNLNLDQHNENWQNIRQKKGWKGQLRDHLVAAITSTELYNVPFMQNFSNYCVHSFAKQI